MHYFMRLIRAIPVLLAFALLGACQGAPYVPGQADEVLGVSMGAVRNAIDTRLDSSKAPSWISADDWKRVRRVYAVWNNAPLWLEPGGVRDRAGALLSVLNEAPSHGLSTARYPIDSVRLVIRQDDSDDISAERLAEADVLLTAAYIGYATDMLMGQLDPKQNAQAWHISRRRNEVDSALVRTLQSPNMQEGLALMAPRDASYSQLRQHHGRYQQIVAAGGWPEVTLQSPRAAVAARLAVEGYRADSSDLRGALRVYQDRHGLEPTGRLDALTVRTLNVPAAERLQQIAINLERHRWLPRSLGEKYIYVNVPAFRLEGFNQGRKELDMRVVVGAEYDGRATPVFADSMEYLVFRPYWNVPPSIEQKEFARYGGNLPATYEFWNDGGVQRLRQRPGDKNSLGLVKFMFPNSFNIYLHDTPAKKLFQRADRAASYGCIRVQDPNRLAQWVLGWDAGRVDAAMNGADNRTVRLPRKVPVFIVYFTAYVRDGQLSFSRDLYDRDDTLKEQLDTVPAGDSIPVPPVRRAE